MTISLGKVLHVPKLERNSMSESQASLLSGLLFVKKLRSHTWELEGMRAAMSVTHHRWDCMK